MRLYKLYAAFAVLLLCACSSERFIPEGGYMLESVRVTNTEPALKSAGLTGYIKQHPNSKWFSLLKIPMMPYLLQGSDSTRWINRTLRRLGEAPVIYDSTLCAHTAEDMRKAAVGIGYLNAEVDVVKKIKKRKISLNYVITPGTRTYVREIVYEFPDSTLRAIYEYYRPQSYLHPGIPFDINLLNKERSRMVSMYTNNGYYKFNRTFIHYLADTTQALGTASLTMQVLPYNTLSDKRPSRHIQFTIDSVRYDERAQKVLRPKVLERANQLYRDDLYNEQNVTSTYTNLARLANVNSSIIHFAESDSSRLNAEIMVNTSKPHSLQLSPEATNTAGDFGAALGLTYQNLNIFHGGETFSIKLRGAYEAVKGLEGYTGKGYTEYSVETSLSFPSFKFPFITRWLPNISQSSTELSIMYDSQDRPEFHRRVLTGALRYRWHKFNRHMQHRLDLIDLNYIFMPWISDTFRQDYLDNAKSRNAILRYNYENIFIMKMGYTYSYTSRPYIHGTNIPRNSSYSIRASIETAGNVLRFMSLVGNTRKHEDGYLHFLNNAYAQYIKGDVDFSKSYRIDDRNSFAFRTYLGIAFPYGNSDILPYEKRYFSGGANSVRGWSVRELGPGTFRGTDGRIDFINQTGDIKLDLSVELRSRLFWKFQGAVFIDAGNIWTIRDYKDQPGGQFHFNKFWNQIAVAYGAGLRLNFDYFVLRLDGGIKAINPAYENKREHYPIVHPSLSRDFTLHFAVGLPF